MPIQQCKPSGKPLYGGSCIVITHKDSSYPLLVFGYDEGKRAEHIAKVNGCNLVRCIPKG